MAHTQNLSFPRLGAALHQGSRRDDIHAPTIPAQAAVHPLRAGAA